MYLYQDNVPVKPQNKNHKQCVRGNHLVNNAGIFQNPNPLQDARMYNDFRIDDQLVLSQDLDLDHGLVLGQEVALSQDYGSIYNVGLNQGFDHKSYGFRLNYEDMGSILRTENEINAAHANYVLGGAQVLDPNLGLGYNFLNEKRLNYRIDHKRLGYNLSPQNEINLIAHENQAFGGDHVLDPNHGLSYNIMNENRFEYRKDYKGLGHELRPPNQINLAHKDHALGGHHMLDSNIGPGNNYTNENCFNYRNYNQGLGHKLNPENQINLAHKEHVLGGHHMLVSNVGPGYNYIIENRFNYRNDNQELGHKLRIENQINQAHEDHALGGHLMLDPNLSPGYKFTNENRFNYRNDNQELGPECYHPSGTGGAGYMTSTAAGSQPSAQGALRVQPTQQQTVPPTQPQDMAKTTMAGHSYVSAQNQTAQPRPQFSNFPYRAAAHGTRPNTHPRPQQQFISGATAAATGPVIFPTTLMYQPSHLYNQQSYPQSRTQGFPLFMPPYIHNYSTPTGHTSSFYYPAANNQPLPAQTLPTNAPGGRNIPTTLVGPQGNTATSTQPTSSLPHPQTQTHMHQPMTGIRAPTGRRSHRIAIINPVTQQDIFSEINSNDSQVISGELNNERQTPQPEPVHNSVEEFRRAVTEVANQPSASESAVKSNFIVKNSDLPMASTTNSTKPQNAISSISNVIVQSDNLLTVEECKAQRHKLVQGPVKPYYVSTVSGSPILVPTKPFKKGVQNNSEQTVQLFIDTNKNTSPQQDKQKTIPVVPQEDLEKPSESISDVVPDVEPVSPPMVQMATVVNIFPATVTQVPTPVPVRQPVPQPQRIREPREQRVKSEEKYILDQEIKEKDASEEKEIEPEFNKPNGPSSPVISSVEVINPPTSESNIIESAKNAIYQSVSEVSLEETVVELLNKDEVSSIAQLLPTATERLSASIEKRAIELPILSEISESIEASSAIQAQAKLTQSIASCLRTNQSLTKMKDVNLNNKSTDPDTANGNSNEETITESKVDINKNDNNVKNTMHNTLPANDMENIDSNIEDPESCENGKDETDDTSIEEQSEKPLEQEEVVTIAPVKKIENAAPKYNYSEDQWSPFNKSGKKCYDIGLLKQIKDDPQSKNKPNAPLLESCNVFRHAPLQEPLKLAPMPMTMFNTITPAWKTPSMGAKSNASRDLKKNSMPPMGGKDSMKLIPTSSGSSSHKPIIRVSLSLRDDIKLNEIENAWKPSRFKKSDFAEDDFKTQELYKKFRGILNKLTPQKFDTLLDRIKALEINTQKRLEGVIDLVFEKAIDEPNFSKAYAMMCDKLSMLKVPIDNATSPDQCVNFRGLIISKCQNQFETQKSDENVVKLEKDIKECDDPMKKKELQLQLEEESRRVRMRSVGNVRFIGELYKLKMLTSKIMVHCMNHLIDNSEEEKLECLCKLLTTIGEQIESELKEQLDNVFKKMQDIVNDRKSNKITSRVRFMIQDVIALRRRKWVVKSVVDIQPKMMDQIQKEAEQYQRHIELMNANPGRRDEGPRGKRGGDGRRQQNSYNDNQYKPSRPNFTIDSSKLKAVQNSKNVNTIKLAPASSGWVQGSGTKSTVQVASNSMISLSKNKFSELDNLSNDSTLLPGFKDLIPSYSKGASIERSTFNSRGDFSSGSNSRSGSTGVPHSNTSNRNSNAPLTPTPAATEPSAPKVAVAKEPLPDDLKKLVKPMIDLCLINPDDDEMMVEIKTRFSPQHHASIVGEILNVALDKPAKAVAMITKSLSHLVSTNTISPEHLIPGMTEIFECAPDSYIDVPMCYEYLGKLLAPHIEKKHITFRQIFAISTNIISEDHGHLLLKALIREIKESMGPSFVKSKWQESGLHLKDWMKEDQVAKWINDNKFEFLEGVSNAEQETKKNISPAETQTKLLLLMNLDESCECIKGWVQDNLGACSNEDWFMRALIQAICEHALSGSEHLHFSQDKMSKYASMIHEFGESRDTREASCLLGIQQLVTRLEHPQGLTLEIFQYLHEQYIISDEGFTAWEVSEKEPEGKAVMKMALTSFFTNIKADNEDSCSED